MKKTETQTEAVSLYGVKEAQRGLRLFKVKGLLHDGIFYAPVGEKWPSRHKLAASPEAAVAEYHRQLSAERTIIREDLAYIETKMARVAGLYNPK